MKIKLIIIVLILLNSCRRQSEKVDTDDNTKESIKDTVPKSDSIRTSIENDFDEGHDELVSEELFSDWKGVYKLSNEYIDGWGRKSLSNIKITLNEPNNCIYESWLTNLENIEYVENNNRYKIVGGVQINASHDSLSFYSSEYLLGESMNLAPVFVLIKNKGNYYVSSILTSPPNNGIIEIPIEKVK